MSVQQLFEIPVARSPKPLEFSIRPQGDQPSIMCSCGHEQWQVEEILLDGNVVFTTKPNFSDTLASLPQILHKRIPHPKKCLLCEFSDRFASALRCSFCHAPIFRGERVSIWNPVDKGIQGFDTELASTVEGVGYVGCDRRDCCPEIFFLAGTWNGEVILTPHQHVRLMEASFAGEGKDGIILL